MEDILYTVPEVAKLLKCNANYAYSLINNGLLPAMKLGSLKVRRSTLLAFLEKYEGMDLSKPSQVAQVDTDEVS